MSGGLSAAHCEHGYYRGAGCNVCSRTPAMTINVEALSKAAGDYADDQLQVYQGLTPPLGVRTALVVAFLTGWRYAMKPQQSQTDSKQNGDAGEVIDPLGKLPTQGQDPQ